MSSRFRLVPRFWAGATKGGGERENNIVHVQVVTECILISDHSCSMSLAWVQVAISFRNYPQHTAAPMVLFPFMHS